MYFLSNGSVEVVLIKEVSKEMLSKVPGFEHQGLSDNPLLS